MNTYRFHASRAPQFWDYGATPTLSTDDIVQSLAGAAVHELIAYTNGGYDVHVQLDRANHADALTELETALLQLGFNIVQAEITELVTAALEGAFLGGAGGGALGSATKDPFAAFAGLVIGAIAGALVGRGMQTIKARYRADRLAPGVWQLTQLPLPQPDSGQQPFSPFA
jgi:hypothetical protein